MIIITLLNCLVVGLESPEAMDLNDLGIAGAMPDMNPHQEIRAHL